MIARVHLAAEVEPTAFHTTEKTDDRFVAVQLALEVKNTDETDAKDQTEAFLEALGGLSGKQPSLKIAHVVVGATTVPQSVQLLTPMDLSPLGPDETPPRVIDWLETARQTYAGLPASPNAGAASAPFYVAAEREIADMRNPRAVELMQMAWRWPAPLPQKAGLVNVVRLPPAPDPAAGLKEFLILVPTDTETSGLRVEGGFETPPIPSYLRVNLVDGTLPHEHFLTNQLDAAPDARPARFKDTGLYDLPANLEALHRLLARVQDRASSLLWAATVMGSRAQADRQADFRVDPNDASSAFSGEKLQWLVRASAASLFDIVIGGLLLPVSNKQDAVTRRSAVLERLSRRVAARFEEDPSVDVDETALYLELHKKLWADLSGMDLPAVWASLGKEASDLPTLYEALTSTTQPDDMTAGAWQTKIAALSSELGTVAALLESESGGEQWLKARLTASLNPSGNLALYQNISGLSGNPAVTEETLNAVFNAFVAEIDGEFDASAALRIEFGAETVHQLARSGKNADDLRQALRASEPLVHRFTPPPAAGGKLLDRLWAGSIDAGTVPAGMGPFLAEAMNGALDVLCRDPEDRADFRPDDAPQPLLIPFADTPDAFFGDGKTEFMSGLALMIQSGPAHAAGTPFTAPPVHLNLAALSANGDPATVMAMQTVDRTLDTFIPVPGPGLAGMTKPYSGMPFSSPGQPEPALSSLTPEQRAQRDAVARMRPYRIDEHDYDAGDQLPDLAYGHAYRYAGLWLPPSGVLPPALRYQGQPLVPGVPQPGSVFWPSGAAIPCRRRTAIAGAELRVARPNRGLDGIPRDVSPISIDQPRVTLFALADGHRHIDLYRGADGVGVLGTDDTIVQLRGVRPSAGFDASLLTVSIHTGTKGDGEAIPAAAVTLNDGILQIQIASPQPAFWIRLRFRNGTPSQALSFIDPQSRKGQSTAERNAQTLLLAPAESADVWQMADKRMVRIDMPRVSFEDFERWAANESLWVATCGAADNDAGKATARKLLDALRTARAMFHSVGGDWPDKLKSLPDPAVSGMLLSLSHADKVTDSESPWERAATRAIPLNPYRRILENNAFQQLDLGEEIDKSTAAKKLAEFAALIATLDKDAGFDLETSAGSFDLGEKDNTRVARVPEGEVAHLSAFPMVDAVLFEPPQPQDPRSGIFHPRMKELSVGERRDGTTRSYLFAGPSLAIEVMTLPDPQQRIPADLLTAQINGRGRGYRLDVTLTPAFRQFVETDIVTQRWRYNRPIYHWINPAEADQAEANPGPVVAIGQTRTGPKARRHAPAKPDLVQFEAELFGGRTPSDADFKRFRLNPSGTTTETARFDWPERSATYFRHRLELISRYAGAMANPGDARIGTALGDTDGVDLWQARVAILAEPDAAPLVRPQIRAYLPLLGRANGERGGPTPITCVLAEPPYAQLGLADRIDAELAARPVFEAAGGLHISDMRKEISPDPLLSYFPVVNAQSLAASVIVEGPAGLHFDGPGADAPAWSNSQYLLRLDVPATDGSATLDELEESFAGIILSRRAATGWSWYDPDTTRPGGAEREQWIPLGEGCVAIASGEMGDAGDSGAPYVRICRKQDTVQVEVLKSALFDQGGAEAITVWHGPADAVLLKPLGDRRYRLGVYRSVSGDHETGSIGGHRLLASVTFFTDGTAPVLRPVGAKGAQQPSGVVATQPCRQSETTLMEWVRSGRDMSTLAVGENETPRALVVHGKADAAETALLFSAPSQIGVPIRVTTPLARRRYPLHVHRRLVAILREPSVQIGDPVALSQGAYLADDWGMVRGVKPKPGASLVLAEMECRAEIVYAAPGVPDTLAHVLGRDADPRQARHREALFDLASTRTGGHPIRQVRFHVRASDGLLDLNRLRLSVTAIGKPAVLLHDHGAGQGVVNAFDLVLWRDPQGKIASILTGRDTQGNPVSRPGPVSDTNVLFDDLVQGPETLALLIDYQGEGVWLDVSMLHSGQQATQGLRDPFDFDWIFGSVSADDATNRLPLAVAAQTLNRLPEAQARLVGVTDPFPIVQS